MPFTKGKKQTGRKTTKATTAVTENKDEGQQVKRSSSSPQGAPKKRTAFIDLTNAHKFPIGLQEKKRTAGKRTARKPSSTGVSEKNQANLLKTSVSSEETIEEETLKAEESQDSAAAPAGNLEDASPPTRHRKQIIPKEFDVDSENSEDLYMCPEYAKDIFDYLKQREEKFVLRDYMELQPSLSPEMRAILVDWLVEVQENFELYHETLYLAVKITDHYLSKVSIQKEMLQLVGSTTMLIASKFEERRPPCVDDFLYICDDAYQREEVIAMEASVLQTLRFDINIPIPYRFLRRYARCVNASMETLTLARYYCELSLLDMQMLTVRGSLLASACLMIALLTKDLGGWSPMLQFHSGYQISDVAPVARQLHQMILAPPDDKLQAIRSKYSHKVFFEVTSLPVVNMEILEKALTSQ